MRIFVMLMLAFSLLAERDVSHLAVTEAMPETLIDGCVSVITGSFFYQYPTITVKGAEPIHIPLSYISGLGQERSGGWTQFAHLLAIQEGRNIYAKEPNGTELHYWRAHSLNGRKRPFRFNLGESSKKQALTNCARGTISARHDLANQYVMLEPDQKAFRLYCSDGTVRYYKWRGRTAPFEDVFLLYWEQKPNGHKIHYDWHVDYHSNIFQTKYKFHSELREIKTTNADGSKTFAWAKYRYTCDPQKRPNFELTTSDGQSYTVSHDRLKHYFYPLYESLGKKDIHFVRYLEGWNLPRVAFTYGCNQKRTDPLLSTITMPDKRIQHIHYYREAKENRIPGNKTITLEGDQDARLKRVSSLRSELGTTRSFIYHPREITKEEEFTEVFDALGNRTIYRSSPAKRLNAIETYRGESTIVGYERFTWNGHRIKCRYWCDENNVPHKALTHIYDSAGNVIQDIVQGNLTGKSTYPLSPGVIQNPSKGAAEKAITKRTFNERNLLTSEQMPNGLLIKYTYHKNTDLIASKLFYEGSTPILRMYFRYNDDNLLIEEITDDGPANTTCLTKKLTLRTESPFIGMPISIREYAYDQLLKRTDIIYNNRGEVIEEKIYDSTNTYRFSNHITYDDRGRPCKTIDGEQRTTYSSYDALNNKTKFIDAAQNSYLMEYDLHNRLVKTVQNERYTTACTYNLKDQKKSETDIYNNKTNYEYNESGNCTQKNLPADSSGKHPKTTITYDFMQNPVSVVDALNHKTQTTYNAYGKPLTITHPDGTSETFTYTIDGELASHTLPNGTTMHHTYDILKRIVHTKVICIYGELLKEERFKYNTFHLLEHQDFEGHVTHYAYDRAGRKISETRNQETIRYGYDTLGRCNQTIYPDYTVITEFDHLDRPVSTKTLQGDQIILREDCTYDLHGNKASITRYPQNTPATEKNLYDYFSRLISHTDALGHTTITSYNETDHLETTTTDPLGRQTIMTYDALGRNISTQKLDGAGYTIGLEETAYDLLNNPLSQTSTIYSPGTLRKTTTTLAYDERSRLVELTEAANTPLERKTTTSYTSTGQIYQLMKPNGVILTHSYDYLDRLAQLYSSDSTVDYQYSYNRLDQIEQVKDKVNQTTSKRTWDPMGRLLTDTLATGHTFNSTYDSQGRRIAFCSSKHTAQYTYIGPLLHTVANHTYRYDLAGNILSDGHSNYTYDLLSRRTSTIHPSYTHTILAFDPCGNILNDSKSIYTYDSHNHLASENNNCYAYDSHHNRIQHNDTHQTINELNQPIDIPHNETGCPLSHKDATLTYDALDRLIAYTTPTEKITYTYDYLNRRLTSTQNGITTAYFYDDRNEIGSTNGEYRILGQGYGAEIGSSVLILIDTTPYVPLHDLFGNITCLLNSEGTPYTSYEYDAFGIASSSTTWYSSIFFTDRNPWRYKSKRLDSTGLTFFGRRYYDPTSGRFLTPDPKGYSEGPNLYQFVLNNPLINYDLYGEMSFKPQLTTPKPQLLIHGDRDRSPNERHIHISGMNNTLEEIMKRGQRLSEMLGNTRVYTVYQPHTSIPVEAGKTFWSYMGFKSNPGNMLQNTIMHLTEELGGPEGGGIINISAHSKGAAILERELTHLPDSIRKMISVETYGAPRPIHPSLAAFVINHVDPKDFVAIPAIQYMQFRRSKLDALPSFLCPDSTSPNYTNFDLEYNINYTIKSAGHCFLGDGYQMPLTESCNRFKMRAGIQMETNLGAG
ncbi:MAG: RHS repeat protein [Chlamydiales bacterium]|nr:RHS repeat protein [Chlamydiales bacterium]